VEAPANGEASPLGLVVGEEVGVVAARVAAEIARLLGTLPVRDRETGLARPARPGDVAILFRSRDSHREFERALEREGLPTHVYKGLGFFDADEIKDLVALVRFLAAPHANLRGAALMRSRIVGLSDAALARLGPDLAAALVATDPPVAREALAAADRRLLDLARASIADWLALVDRVSPSELVDRVLAGSAYAVELAGPRARQARENVKKFRALVRRIENRGYATLDRLATHIDRLAVGDEANAVLEAVDAVSLMTVHASKGLEFPVVFLVNLARGVSQRRHPIRVRLDHAGDGASVSVESFLSEADTLEPAIEREETKRLLYVALTRARDVLYLSTLLKDGTCRPGTGSLAAVMPASMHALLASAGTAADGASLTWTGSSGVHLWRVAHPEWRPEATGEAPAAPAPPPAGQPSLPFDVEPAPVPFDRAPATPRVALTAALRTDVASDGVEMETEGDARIVGRVVHRLMRRFPPGSTVEHETLQAAAASLIIPDERVALDDETNAVERAATLYRRLAGRRDVIAIFQDADPAFEVPFSMRDGARVVRGTIDCLLRRRDGGYLVVEIKTGPPRPEHTAQLDAYVRAVQCLSPGTDATGVLLHP
jgi:ATP-dependent exoDNAse (exonuclease V) beta subunit